MYTALHRRIADGDLTPGAKVPGEIALAAEHEVSRNTVRAALIRLVQEGLITEGKGPLGRTVRADRTAAWRRQDRGQAVSTLLDDIDAARRSDSVQVGIEPLPAEIAAQLGLANGTMGARRTHTTAIDDVPYQRTIAWFREAVRDTALMEPTDTRDVTEILSELGFALDDTEDLVVIRMPSLTESRELDLPAATPLAEITRNGTQHGATMWVSITIAPGNRNRLVYRAGT